MATQSADQTTTLHLVIGGLCLLVRDEDRDDGKRLLHVLLPKGKHSDHHVACLVFDAVYDSANSSSNGICMCSLDDVEFDFSGQVVGTITGPMKIGGVADESCMRGTKVKRKLLDKSLDKSLKARITIPAGREGPGTNVGVLWELGDCLHYMATLVHWEIPDLPPGIVTLRYKQNGTQKRIDLTPQDGAIELFFLHEIEEHLPDWPPHVATIPDAPEPPEDEYEAEHFTDLYPLVGKSSGKAPKYKPKLQPRSLVPHALRGLDYTCIIATAPAERGP
ncbi:MAG TPA: hypothetical protein VGB92_16990 [Longimicrobium sp.]|jgi:hypothetical protein